MSLRFRYREASGGQTLLHRIALLAIAAPRRVIAFAVLLAVALGIFGVPVAKSLSASGFQDPTAESAAATRVPDRQVPSRRCAVADRRFDARRRRQRSSSRGRQRNRRPATQFATRRAGDVAMDRAAASRRGSGQPRPHVGTHRGGHQRRREPAAEIRQGVVRPGRRTTTTASPCGRVAPRWSTSRSPSSRSATCW